MQLKDLLEKPLHELSDDEVQKRIALYQKMRVSSKSSPTSTPKKKSKKSLEEVEAELDDFLKEIGG